MQQAAPISAVKSLGHRMRERREQLGLSQKEVAQRAGVAQTTVAMLETGSRTRPRELLRLAEALRVSPDWLQYGNRGEKPAVVDRSQEPPTNKFTVGNSSLPVYKSPSPIKWEDLSVGSLPDEFCVVLQDDAMAPAGAPKGTKAIFLRGDAFQPGDAVLVQDKRGAVHFREARLNKSGAWEAFAYNPAFPTLDSVEDGLRVIAVFNGLSAVGWAQLRNMR